MTEYEFTLSDRIQKIQAINNNFNLEENAYISFSGGKDSVVLSHLIDMALPNNKIPRVYLNTGIEYLTLVSFVERERERDSRIEIIKPKKNIRTVLEQYGYPFKSKEHSQKVSYYQNSGKGKTVKNYLGEGTKSGFLCPDKLRYNFTPEFKIKVSDLCCKKLKKEVAENWAKENRRSITITGVRQEEKGLRSSMQGCTVFYDDNCKELKKFHPLFPCDDNFINEFIKQYKIELCALYYPPYNFKRTGCKGCPFSTDLQRQLDIMAVYLPEEHKQGEMIWSKVYKEYRRIHYRLEETLFDNL